MSYLLYLFSVLLYVVTVSAAIRGCQLEEAMAAVSNTISQEALGLAEGLGDLYCKVGSYTKALEAYRTQVRGCCIET